MVIFRFLVLIFSAILHEVAHGYTAYKLGDDTALRMGRITLNPLSHLDPIGSLFLPLILYLTSGGSFIFGWAKPVPYNPLKLKDIRRDSAILAFAGPLVNLLLALVFGILIRLIVYFNFYPLVPLFSIVVGINLMLAVFNLIPLPPLDGSKIFFYLFPSQRIEMFLNRYSFLLLFIVLIWGWNVIFPIVKFLFFIITGLPL
ncbi:MAG: site-2 protease family protein [Candidatus Paceibacterota bacterium]